MSSYLFLQGPASLFFSDLARTLRDRGHRVWRINFNGGDRAFWRLPGGIDYLGRREDFRSFILRKYTTHGITDIVLLGDCRPLHKLAIEAARLFGIRTHIFEEGYIRPNWVTLEQSGVNGFSSLPRDISALLRAVRELPPEPPAPPVAIAANFARRALDDVIYSAATLLMAGRYRHYERHWPYGQLAEYLHGGRRIFSRKLHRRRHARKLAALLAGNRPLYVFPMQVDVDSQIIFHSQFRGQADVIRLILQSFARHAPADAILCITEHPLETSPTDWRALVERQAAEFRVNERVAFLPGGSPRELLTGSRGIIVVNSTTGHLGLELGIPVIALSPAVFNLEGITFQGGLDRFWREAAPADLDLIAAYRRVVIRQTQLNGGFFSQQGMAHAVANALPRLEARQSEVRLTAPAELPLYALNEKPDQAIPADPFLAGTQQEKFI